jgi:hypothetical protein
VSKALKAEYVMQGAPKASSITRAKRFELRCAQNMTVTMAYDATKLKVFGSHATLADLLTPRLVANPFSAMHMGHSLGCGVGRGGRCQQLRRSSSGSLAMMRRCAGPRHG